MLNLRQVAIFIYLLTISFFAIAADLNYVGIDYKYRSMRGNYTESYEMRSVLPSNYNEGQVYYARRFASGVGFDLTYEQSQNKQQTHVFSAQELFLGNPQHKGDVSVIFNKIIAGQFNLLGYANVTDNFEALGQLGLSIMHADMTGTLTSSGTLYNLSPGSTYKIIPRIGFGLQYFFAKFNFGIRGIVAWEGTDWYRLKMTDDDGIRYSIKPFKDSWCFIAGVVAKF